MARPNEDLRGKLSLCVLCEYNFAYNLHSQMHIIAAKKAQSRIVLCNILATPVMLLDERNAAPLFGTLLNASTHSSSRKYVYFRVSLGMLFCR